MNALKLRFLVLLVAMLPACGQQLVEFPFPDDSGGNTADAPTGATIADARAADAPTGTTADAPTSPDGTLGADARLSADAATGSDGSVAVADAGGNDPGNDAGGPLTVLSTNPADLATGVSVNRMVEATFNRAVNDLTVNVLTFTLDQGLNRILGEVTYDDATNTARFNPDDALAIGQTYRGTITTGVMDAAGETMSVDHVWVFTIGACSQEPITLLTAGGYAVLAGATVTSTGLTSITGNLGVFPGAAVTGFPPGVLVGTMNAANAAAGTAIGDLTTAYNDAAGRTLCPISVSGNLGGQTLGPGLYKSTSDLAISAGDLTLDAMGDADAVFIFQIASLFDVTPGRHMVLINDAKAANVFFQVGTSATIGTTAILFGTIMADQSISLATGATLNGRALARIGGVTMQSNTIVTP